MIVLNSYLNFNGNTEEVFNFYKSVFGGEFSMLQRFKDTPDADKMPPHTQEQIMHIALPIGGNVLMGTDVPDFMEQVKPGTNISLSIHVDTKEEANRLYDGLAAGGKSTMPMTDMFWGDYFGMLTDKFEIQWMISCVKPKE